MAEGPLDRPPPPFHTSSTPRMTVSLVSLRGGMLDHGKSLPLREISKNYSEGSPTLHEVSKKTSTARISTEPSSKYKLKLNAYNEKHWLLARLTVRTQHIAHFLINSYLTDYQELTLKPFGSYMAFRDNYSGSVEKTDGKNDKWALILL